MRRLALLLGLLGAAPALAQQNVLLFQPPLAPILNLDFTRMSTLDSRINFARASVKNDFRCGSNPNLVTFSADVPAIPICDQKTGTAFGLGIEGPSTIANVRSRDLTNASWTKTNVTASLNQTGIDGVANSGSQISATGANGTALAAGGVSGTRRAFSAYVKRLVGVGEIDVTQDGVNWTPITSSINSLTWTRVPAAGLYSSTANASIGFRIVTSGDSVAVDYVNQEADLNGAYVAPTTPILTTSSPNIARATDNAWVDLTKIPGWNPDHFTVVVKYMIPTWTVLSQDGTTARRSYFQIDDGMGENAIFVNNQTDPFSDTSCAPSGVGPLHCPDFNLDAALATGSFSSIVKVRATATPSGGSVLQGLAPPGAGSFATVAISYDPNYGTSITANNGGAATALSNGFAFPAGKMPALNSGGAIVPAFSTGTMKRLVLGGAPNETTAVGGTSTAGDVLSLIATSNQIAGSPVTVSYTVQNGDSTTAIAAALASAINASATLTTAGVTATSSGASVLPTHAPGMFVTWTNGRTGAFTETFNQSSNTGGLWGYLLQLQVYPKALQGAALVTALFNSTPNPVVPSYLLQASGIGNFLYETGAKIQCNKC